MGLNFQSIKTFKRSEIVALTKKLSALRFGYNFNDAENYLRTKNEAERLGLSVVAENYDVNGEIFHFDSFRRITKQQTAFGKAWLKNYFFKLDGRLRSGKATQDVSERILNISNKVSRFEFIGVLGLKNSRGDFVQFLPIYRTYSRDGKYFDYAPIHWGRPVLMEGY